MGVNVLVKDAGVFRGLLDVVSGNRFQRVKIRPTAIQVFRLRDAAELGVRFAQCGTGRTSGHMKGGGTYERGQRRS